MFTIMHFLLIAILSTILPNFANSLPQPLLSRDGLIRQVWEFPNETWVENIAVRSNGQLLVTILSSPELYQVNPFIPEKPVLINQFPNASGLLGIAEIEQDIFAVVAGNWSTVTFETTNGSYSIWRVDLTRVPPISTKITDIPEASFLNGMTLVERGSNFLLISDSELGVVFRLDFLTGQYGIVLDNALMKRVPNQIPLGINGIHTRGGFLYFTNTFQGLFARVSIHSDGTASGPYELIAYTGAADDFTFDKSGNAYITQDPGDALERVTPSGEVNVLVGSVNSTIVEGDTAAQFGRTPFDKSTLYITTNGGIAGHVAGTDIVGGKVLAVNIPALLKNERDIEIEVAK